ncbi:NAD(P)-dependent alcohol dehydrogenase [Bailinhaonella thermotolerans]|uniref:NAD(P)-dependent alcohol dehydrogenase n=1 Tax=Bailinhaonella thermotolerans TaxID=1070861 RepID=UPI001F5BF109|nr:NAD(P)-dependent alcohol dehydrogenase [Bailinhaonella thermotolerans]
MVEAAVLRDVAAPYSVERVEMEEPGAGEVLVRIAGAGMCHTDMLGRVPGDLVAKPVILGHEGAGVVEAVGPGVTGVQEGDHVVLSYDSCGRCGNCLAGSAPYCDEFLLRNLTGLELDGRTRVTDESGKAVLSRWFGQSSFASHSLVEARNAVVIPKDLRLETMAPLGCGVQTGAGSVLVALKVAAGSSIAVFGAGAVGLSAVMAARVAGAATIIAVDLHEKRLELARELGATHTFDGRDPELQAQVTAVTGGGAHYSFDTTGVPGVIATAVGSLRPTGVCGLVALGQGDIVLDPNVLALGRTVMGIFEGNAVPRVFIPRLIELWRQGRMPFDRLVTTYPLSEINAAEAASHSGDVIKPVLLPGS